MSSPENPQRQSPPVGDMVALVLVAAFAAAAAWGATRYGLWNHGEPGPGLFPLIVCAATIVFSLLSLAALASGFMENQPAALEELNQEGPVLWRKLLLYIATILVWPWLLAPLGFLLATAIALTVIVRFAERSSWAASSVLVAGAIGLCWLVFNQLLGVPLPKVPIGFG